VKMTQSRFAVRTVHRDVVQSRTARLVMKLLTILHCASSCVVLVGCIFAPAFPDPIETTMVSKSDLLEVEQESVSVLRGGRHRRNVGNQIPVRILFPPDNSADVVYASEFLPSVYHKASCLPSFCFIVHYRSLDSSPVQPLHFLKSKRG
jgi:hypothetical protein